MQSAIPMLSRLIAKHYLLRGLLSFRGSADFTEFALLFSHYQPVIAHFVKSVVLAVLFTAI